MAKRLCFTIDNGIISTLSWVSRRRRDETSWRGLPGLANLHSHAFQRGMAGLTEGGGGASDSFWSWRAICIAFCSSSVRTMSRLIAALASRDGGERHSPGIVNSTTFTKLRRVGHGQPRRDGDALGSAASETGIGLTYCRYITLTLTFGGAAPLESQRRFATSRDQDEQILSASRNAISPWLMVSWA